MEYCLWDKLLDISIIGAAKELRGNTLKRLYGKTEEIKSPQCIIEFGEEMMKPCTWEMQNKITKEVIASGTIEHQYDVYNNEDIFIIKENKKCGT
jgi:hypothetical protein